MTGGAGYTGSHTVLTLLKEGYSVVVVDNCVNCAPPTTKNPWLPPSLTRVQDLTGRAPIYYNKDLADAPALSEIFRKVIPTL